MAVNFDAILKIGAEVAGMGSVTKLSDTLINVSKSARLAAQENARVFSTDGIERQMAAATAASIQILDADKQVLASRMKLLDNDRDRAAAQNQMAALEVKGAELRRKQTEEQLAGELKTAQAKKTATQLELQRAQSVVSSAGAYGKITPEMLKQVEAARTADRIAKEELTVTTSIVAEKRKVADAQVRVVQAQVEAARGLREQAEAAKVLKAQETEALRISELRAKAMREIASQGTRLQSVLSGLNSIDASFSRGFDAVLNSRSWQAAAAAAAGFGVALVTSTKAAIDFEASVSQVRKVMDGLETPAAIKEISTEIIGLSKQLPVSAKGFAEIYAAAGASGIARSEVKAFAQDVAGLSVAFEMTADQAGTSIAKLRNSLGMTQPEVMKLADAMNYLDQQTAARASQLVEFALRSGAVGQQAGLAAEKTVAFGAAMISAGADTEVAATSFNNMVKALTRGNSMTERQVAALQTLGFVGKDAGLNLARAMQESAEPTIRDFIDRIKAMPKEMQASIISDFFGDETRALPALIQNVDNLAKSLDAVGGPGNYAGSMAKELGVQMGTTAAQMQLAKNNVEALQIEIGNLIVPIINQLVPGIIAVVQALSGLAQANPLLTQIAIGIGAIGAAAVIALPVVAGLGMAIKTIAGFGLGATLAGWAGAFPAVIAGLAGIASTIASVATGLAALVAGFVTAPILIGAAAVATAVVIFSFRDQIADAFRGLWDLIANPTTGFVAMIGGGWNLMMDGLASYVGNILPNISGNFAAFFDTIIGPENGLIARLGQTWNAGMDGIRDYALGLVEPITAAWDGIVNSLRGSLNGLLSWGANGVNRFIDIVNSAIARINSVSSRVGITAQPIQYVEVPSFAGGGYTGNGPRSGGLDGQGGFMAMVHPQEQVIDLQRSPSRTSAGGTTGGISRGGGTFAPTIQVQTGPVQQQPDGSQWIRREDAEAMVSDGIGQLWDHIQTYDGRQALGMA
jgi:TP901 family phage tail tape measure protein